VKLVAIGAAAAAALAQLGPSGAAAPAVRSIVLVDKPFRCEQYAQPLAFELVKVTLTPSYGGSVDDAVNLNRGECTGRVGRIEVDTWIGDGVKIGENTHDLVVESGYVVCHDRVPGKHQDGVQALGGLRVTFRNLHVYCATANNASFFATAGAGGADLPTEGDWPTDVTCDNCQLDGGPHTLFLGKSIRSGIRNSLVHAGKYRAIRIGEAVDPVVENVVELPCGSNCPDG
jgi:hypothetical protein